MSRREFDSLYPHKNSAIIQCMNLSKYIPLDKSWIIRMGILDLVNGKEENSIKFLDSQETLSADLEALRGVLADWREKDEVEVGESGTLYRFLKFLSWKTGAKKKFILSGTLKTRNICDDPGIINWPQAKLLELDNGTSQLASAAALLGNKERISNPPYKLKVTYEAIDHWKEMNGRRNTWQSRPDQTISKQAEVFSVLLSGSKVDFVPEQAEDYCFARAFDFISKEEGQRRWPSLRGHESDRILEMETALEQYKSGEPVISKDHRVVQALAMKGAVEKKKVSFKHPEAVSKSWPEFWNFLDQQ